MIFMKLASILGKVAEAGCEQKVLKLYSLQAKYIGGLKATTMSKYYSQEVTNQHTNFSLLLKQPTTNQ